MTKTHGFTSPNATKEQKKFYNTRCNIKSRCNNKNNTEYNSYGGRGILCTRNIFEDFRDDMREGFILHVKVYGLYNTTIDRINVNGNYEKENCRRATWEEQYTNRQKDIYAIIDGVKIKPKELQEKLGMSEGRVRSRIRKYNQGLMSKERLFSKEKLFQERKKFNVDGERYDVWRLMDECNITLSAAEHRLRDYNKGKITKEKLFRYGNVRYRKK